MKPALFFLNILTASSILAGDHFSYRPKSLAYDFATPFDNPGEPKLPTAKLTITTRVDEEGQYRGMEDALLGSIEVELGKQRLLVPTQILRDLGAYDLGSIDFYWVGRRYYIVISRKRSDPVIPPTRTEFVFKDGALVDVWVNDGWGNKSLRKRYPKILDATLEHPAALPK